MGRIILGLLASLLVVCALPASATAQGAAMDLLLRLDASYFYHKEVSFHMLDIEKQAICWRNNDVHLGGFAFQQACP